jgi:hypothetical protein
VTGCCAPACRADSVPDAPVPLCGRHLRKTYQFAADMVSAATAPTPSQISSGIRAMAARVHGRRGDADGYVYFIRFADRIKIGWSSRPYRRIAELPHDEVLAIVPGTIEDERAYHQQFSSLHEQGEWFRLDQELIDLAATLDATRPRPSRKVSGVTLR